MGELMPRNCKLKNCGGHAVPVRKEIWGKCVWAVVCTKCGARTQIMPSKDSAIRLWNSKQ